MLTFDDLFWLLVALSDLEHKSNPNDFTYYDWGHSLLDKQNKALR